MNNRTLTRFALVFATALTLALCAPLAALAEEPAPAKEKQEAPKPEAEQKAAEVQPDQAPTDTEACKPQSEGYFNTLEDFFAATQVMPAAQELAEPTAEPEAGKIEWTEAEPAEKKAETKPEPKKAETD